MQSKMKFEFLFLFVLLLLVRLSLYLASLDTDTLMVPPSVGAAVALSPRTGAASGKKTGHHGCSVGVTVAGAARLLANN